jgi:trigger factor
MSEDDGLSFCATITLLPEVKYKDFKKVKYTEPKIIINDEEVEKVINDLRDYQATKASVKRPAQTGDRVEVDYQLTLAGVPVENGQQKNFSFIIGKKQVLPEFENSVLSLEINGEKEFVLTFPDDYFAKHLAGKKVDAKITVRNILARSLPELNDVFSKKVGQETVVALRSAIKDNLYQEKYRGANLAAEQKMIEQAIAVATYSSIPDLLINNEVEKMIVELKSQISQQGIKFEDYILRLGKKEEGLRLEFVPKALERVKASLLLRAIAKNENINVDHEEVHKEINKHLANVKDEKIKERLQSNEWHEYVETYLRQEKVIKWLKEKCK